MHETAAQAARVGVRLARLYGKPMTAGERMALAHLLDRCVALVQAALFVRKEVG
ncbi:MAG TPA: hypothetical protein VFQ35_19930 [Polyangiaceae bacterium]|nr:hypothetical protein [Polyangiaceae bacterium]